MIIGDSFRDFWDNIVCTNILSDWDPRGKRKIKGLRKFLKRL